MTTTLTGLETSPDTKIVVSQPPSQPGKKQLALLLASIILSAVVFLALDWFRTAAIQKRWRQHHPRVDVAKCLVPDPVRHHAYEPNCAATVRWGTRSYQVLTNSLGFRDEKIRDVSPVDPRPRILVLGDSMTLGMVAWPESYVGRIAAHFPQYEFLNGGVIMYSPSNYLSTTRIVLGKGMEIDEVLVFIDMSDVQYEAGFYQDVDNSGAVTYLKHASPVIPPYTTWRAHLAKRLLLTSQIQAWLDRLLVRLGHYHLPDEQLGDIFDNERAAWSYRKVDEIHPPYIGYAPLGVEGGIAKEKAKLDLLWQELQKRKISLSLVVYPHPGQLVHDTPDSRQVQIWRDWCAGKCKRFISLFPAFFAARDQCPPLQAGCWYAKLFVFGDIHFAAAGNALVADEIAMSLKQTPPVKRLASPQSLASRQLAEPH